MDQLSFLDIVNAKDREKLIPGVWDCLDTCANFTNLEADGTRDYFPGTREPRCTRLCQKSKLDKKTQTWHTICLNYKPKDY